MRTSPAVCMYIFFFQKVSLGTRKIKQRVYEAMRKRELSDNFFFKQAREKKEKYEERFSPLPSQLQQFFAFV